MMTSSGDIKVFYKVDTCACDCSIAMTMSVSKENSNFWIWSTLSNIKKHKGWIKNRKTDLERLFSSGEQLLLVQWASAQLPAHTQLTTVGYSNSRYSGAPIWTPWTSDTYEYSDTQMYTYMRADQTFITHVKIIIFKRIEA